MQRAQEDLIAHFQSEFLDGDLHTITPFFVYPLPLTCAGTSEVVYETQAALSHAMQTCRDAIRARGVTRIEPELAATGLPRDGRATLWVDWLEYDADARHIGTRKVQYVMSLPEGVDVPQVERVIVAANESISPPGA